MKSPLDSLSRPAGVVVLMGLLSAIVLLLVPAGASNDLRALWLAAGSLATGDPASVYPPAAPVFTMTPPPAWAEANPGKKLFPYLYPPLWAALAAPATTLMSFEAAATVFRVINAGLLVGCTGLAWRVTGSRLPFPIFACIGVLLLSQTFVGSLALMENQPQIAVSFLLLLSLERLKSGAPRTAGAVLALAAALKVYPVIFVLIWIALGERRATLAFAVTGGIFGALSIAVAGWPLHEAFLSTIATISGSVLLTPVSYGLTPALAQIAARGAFTYQEAGHGGWLVMALPPFTNGMARLLLLTALAALATAMRRASDETLWAMLWPAALLVVSLLGPLSWAYHYIPSLAAAPIVIDRLGSRGGGLALLLVALPLSPLVAGFALDAGLPGEYLQLGGTLALSALTGLFVALASGPRSARTA